MSINVPRGNADPVIDQIIAALRPYEIDHPHAKIDVYRQNPVSVRVRIIDPALVSREKSDRHALAWKYLGVLPDEVQSDVSSLLLLTPQEASHSLANLEFEDPVPSQL